MSKTAIIVGAGASHEFNLPVGEGLKKKISDLCQTSSQGRNQSIANSNFEDSLQRIVRSAFEPKTYTQADLVRAAYDISTNMPLAPSIDNFLHTKSENPLVVLTGKLAIAHCIHQAERDSLLNTTTSSEYEPLDFWRVEKTWILKLFKILAAQSNFEQFIEKLNNVEFISFN